MNNIVLPEWFENLMIAGLALAPVTTTIVQLIKIVAARLGLPEGYSGFITLIVATVMVALAVSADVLREQVRVRDWLEIAQRVAEGALTVLGAFGWYKVGKAANVMRAITWKKGE
jgi:hypothetical protein